MRHNPLEAGQHLLKEYRSKLRFALEGNELTTESIEQILNAMQIDSGIYLSLNPVYERSDESFANFVLAHELPEKLATSFPKLAESGLYTHQRLGILSILDGRHTIISTGTGSGKTETFLIPIIGHCLQSTQRGVKAIIIYPMNALASDQVERIGTYTEKSHITFGLYTGATPEHTHDTQRRFPNQLVSRSEIRANPPDILITNYVMLDRMLTREKDHRIFEESSDTLRYIVLDELHTYTGSKATQLKYLLARLRNYWQNNPMYIGTSATLVGDSAGRQRLDTYLSNLLGIEPGEYTFIEAVEEQIDSSNITPPQLLKSGLFKTPDYATEDSAATSIGEFTGQPVDTFDFYKPPEEFHETTTYKSIYNNYYVAAIRSALHQSAQSYDDLLREISQAMPPEQFKSLTPDQILAASLEAITYLNEKAGEKGKPLLDFRLHVFFQNLTGILRRCPVCGHYYSGDVLHCTRDGYALFAVYRHDIRLMIGKFSEQSLKQVLEPESTDVGSVHYVLIGHSAIDDLPKDFELRGDISRNGSFQVQPAGMFLLAPMNASNYDQLSSALIEVGDYRRDYLYLVQLVRLLLQIYGKSLGFVDSRELASRYGAIIRDEFASDFLSEFLRLNYPRPFHLEETLRYLQKRANDLATSDLEKRVFVELPIWFYRMIAMPERLGGDAGIVWLREEAYDWDTLNELQRALLDIFIRERAIDAVLTASFEDTYFIRFQKYWATGHYGIYLEDTVSSDPNYRGISLGISSRVYADFIDQWSSEAIQQATHELLELGILIQIPTPDDKVAYYLKPQYLCFNLAPSSYGEGDDGYTNLRKDLLFNAEVHSSDLSGERRRDIETLFKKPDGDVHFVAATPTLEMGIDIGDLECVLMIGAPPTPANYAQRAGRAGRGKKHEALIATFCSPSSIHDTYAFRNPRTVINGKIAPPALNPANPEILKQHINAFMLRHHLSHRKDLQQISHTLRQKYMDQIPQMMRLFGNWFEYEKYADEFVTLPEEILRETNGKRSSLAQYCYSQGIFPDYSFQRDQVIAIDIEDRNKLDDERTLDWKDYALTSRNPEQAFHFFVPDQVIYVAGEIYRTLHDGIYTVLDDGAHQYTCFYAEKEVLFATQRKEVKQLDLRQHFRPSIPNLRDCGGVLAIGYADDCLLSFRNFGMRGPNKAPSAPKELTPIGYDLRREALILRFDRMICDEVLRNSLSAALMREINRRYGLADGEVSLMLNAKPPDELPDSRWNYSIFYDGDGNSNLPFKDAVRDFQLIIESVHGAVSNCVCETDGCYDCIRSYNTQYFDYTLSKAKALMFAGYLLGKNAFMPEIVPFTPLVTSHDLVLRVSQQNNAITVTSSTGQTYSQATGNDALNDVIFQTLTQAVYCEFQTDMKALRIEVWVDWLAQAINNRHVNKGKDTFNRFQFALLRFERVEAVCVKRGNAI